MKNSYIYFLLIVLNLIVIIITKWGLNINELLYNQLSEQLIQEQVVKILESQKKWSWVGFAIIPFIILIRSSLVALCLSIGLFFYDTDNNIKFKQFFRIALFGEFVLVLVGCFKFAYFYFIKSEYNLLEVQQYYPFSYTNFLDLNKIEPWLIYPLQTVNLFELMYFLVLTYGLWKLIKNKFLISIEITAISYGSGLLIWLALIMFLTLNFT